uniref:RIIa domain-containing protein n=1 Tax=Elaeophora elaphi TaxID=1147741 RepID=A0A0R3S5P3_9BILA
MVLITEDHMAESSSENYKVPAGLRPLLEALVRETLRTQPIDLISFSVLFFNVLQKHRKQNNAEDVLKDPALYESFKTDLQKQYYEKDGMVERSSSTPLDEAATKIQAAYRGHIVRANPQKFGLRKKDTDIIWPSTDCISLIDAEKDLKCHSVDATGSVIEKDAIEDRAATIIQAEIRGFLTRRHLQQEKKEGNEAAKKIQAHIRGYLTRKHLDEVGIPYKHSSVLHLHNGLQERV